MWFGRQLHGRLPVSGLSDDVEAVVAEDLDDVEAEERLILGDDDTTGGGSRGGGVLLLLSHL